MSEICCLGDLVEKGWVKIFTGPFGSVLHKHEYMGTGVSVVPAEAIVDGSINIEKFNYISDEKAIELKRHRLAPDDIVFARRGAKACGLSALVHAKDCANIAGTGLIYLRVFAKDKVDPYYLFLAVSNAKSVAWLKTYAIGATMPNLNGAVLKSIPLELPTYKKQLLIASQHRPIAAKLQLNNQINQTLDQIAHAIFKSWFVDFEPVEAKQHIRALGGNDEQTERAAQAVIAGAINLDVITTATDLRALDHRLTQALGDKLAHQTEAQREQLTKTAQQFPDRLVESELGLIPGGWEVSTIGEEVTVVGGGTPSTKKNEFWGGGTFNWTTPKDLSGLTDKILLWTERRITQAGLNKISSGLLPVNTVLMSSRAPVGYLALAKIPVAINQGYIAMKCTGRITAEYVIQWANFAMDDIKQRASGTTFEEISKKNFRIIPLVVPAEEVVHCYSRLTGALYQTITDKISQSFVLADIRDSLLPKLLSGELAPNQLHQTHN